MGRLHRSKVTVLVIDQPGEQVDPAVRLENINWWVSGGAGMGGSMHSCKR